MRRIAILIVAAVSSGLLISRWAGHDELLPSVRRTANDESRDQSAQSVSNERQPISLDYYPCVELSSAKLAELTDALRKCRAHPKWSQVSSLLHALMLWGERNLSSVDDVSVIPILRRLTHDTDFAAAYPTYPAFLVETRYGSRFVESRASSQAIRSARDAHWGQTLSVLAESGLSLDYPIEPRGGSSTIQKVLDDLVANFSLSGETEWAVSALALYRAHNTSWTNKLGHTYSFNQVAKHLIEKPVGHGTCTGTHVLYALAIIRQAGIKRGVLSAEVLNDVNSYLRDASARLERTQLDSGAWNPGWSESAAASPRVIRPLDEIWVTGHHLDWMALVPHNLRVPDEAIENACHFVINQTNVTSEREVSEQPCHFFHGIRATVRLIPINSAMRQSLTVERAIFVH